MKRNASTLKAELLGARVAMLPPGSVTPPRPVIDNDKDADAIQAEMGTLAQASYKNERTDVQGRRAKREPGAADNELSTEGELFNFKFRAKKPAEFAQ